MGVVQRRHEQLATAVVHLAEGSGLLRGRSRIPDIGDHSVAHTHPLMREHNSLLGQQVDIGEEHGETFLNCKRPTKRDRRPTPPVPETVRPADRAVARWELA